MSKRRQDGNLRDVTESDNCVPDFTSARFFAARISFLFGTRIGIRHAAAFFTRLICKLFHGWERKTAPPTFIAGRARWQCRTLCTHRGANEENAVLEALDRKKTKQNPKYSVQGMSLSAPLSVNSKIYTAFQGASAYADFDCGRP